LGVTKTQSSKWHGLATLKHGQLLRKNERLSMIPEFRHHNISHRCGRQIA
jgi:hypothetical protein